HRTYTAEKFFALTEKIRAARPGIAITTDVIVGFPGETEEDFAATRDLVERVEFDHAFIFRYSKRKDTPAAEMNGQLPDEIKEARNQTLLQVVDGIARRKADALVGTNVEILCEGPSKTNSNRLTGRTRTNKVVVFEGAQRHVGQIFDVRITHTTGFTLYGDPAVLNA
ncbi:MAG TPA: TRAM domain-containing protein, partial [Chthoniobacterales bacterium]